MSLSLKNKKKEIIGKAQENLTGHHAAYVFKAFKNTLKMKEAKENRNAAPTTAAGFFSNLTQKNR